MNHPESLPPLIQLGQLARHLGISFLSSDQEPALLEQLTQPITSISTDTRTMAPGCLFVALRGERFDAHDHLTPQVLTKAAAVLLSRAPDQLPGFHPSQQQTLFGIVPDTLHALGELANLWLNTVNAHHGSPQVRIGLCGSSGKTTTKEMLSDILAAHHRSAHATPGNLNNLIGLPQTIFGLRPHHEAGIFELGMNLPGEARRLVEISHPTALLLTNINHAHVGQFGTMEALYQAECESLRAASEDCLLLINHGDPTSIRAQSEWAGTRNVLTFQPEPTGPPADWLVSVVHPLSHHHGYHVAVQDRIKNREATFNLPVFGIHNVANALTALALACDERVGLGLPLDTAAQALSQFHPRLNRSEMEEFKGAWIIKDFYNAVPAAVISALKSLGHIPAQGRKMALLSEMRELGDLEREFHLKVGRTAAEAEIDVLITVGEKGRWIHDEAKSHGLQHTLHFPTKAEATHALKDLLQPGDVLLIKGARMVGLETVYSELTGRDAHLH
jgi:UDP-N-acetylmuramoyl-tripeptide--D-alanyl-D-alanine ligase